MRKLLGQVMNTLFADASIKLLALLITVVLWLSVAGQQRQVKEVTLTGIDISLVSLPASLAITSSEPVQASVTLRGPEEAIRELRLASATRTSDLTAVADLTGATEGIHYFPLRLRGLPAGVLISTLLIDPDMVRVSLEPVGSRQLPVDLRPAGTVPEGYRLVSTRVNPETVLVRGPESLIGKMNEVATTTLNLTGRTASFTARLSLDVTIDDVVALPDEVEVAVTIEEISTTRTITGVAVTTEDGVAAAVEPDTLEVTVRGPASTLAGLDAEWFSAVVGPGTNVTPRVALTNPLASRVEILKVSPRTVRWKRQ